MRLRVSVPLALAALFTLSSPLPAAQYEGWGDTGWVYASKRDCCAGAIALAYEDSEARCLQAGGLPRQTSGVRRGSCQWDWTTDASGAQLYRCHSEAAVHCR
jgi:hypothetical protein